MNIRDALAAGAAMVLLSTALAYAGPCSKDISDVQLQFDSKLNSVAASGPPAAESTEATMHRQPTPGSIAHAEESLGEISPENTRVFTEAMTRARDADAAGKVAECQRALDDARHVLAN